MPYASFPSRERLAASLRTPSSRRVLRRCVAYAARYQRVASLINSFKVFREVYLLTGDYPYDTLYMLQHFMNNTFKALDYQKLSAAAIIMCSVMVVIIGLLFVVENHFGKDVEG